MLVRLVQSLNALSPILVTLLGILMLVRLAQSENAYSPISVTLSGIVMHVRLVQSEYLQPVITQYFASNKSEIWS